MFAILFGLSMDYEVFLLTQIQEHYKKDGDPHEAVVRGLASTGRVITSAALIMVFVFSSFVLNGNAIVKQFGVGSRRGDRDRRDDRALPRGAGGDGAVREGGVVAAAGLDRVLPPISIEGEDYFEERDKPPPAPEKPPSGRGLTLRRLGIRRLGGERRLLGRFVGGLRAERPMRSQLQLTFHRLGERHQAGGRPDHVVELVDHSLVIEVDEVASLDLAVTDASAEDERAIGRFREPRSRACT